MGTDGKEELSAVAELRKFELIGCKFFTGHPNPRGTMTGYRVRPMAPAKGKLVQSQSSPKDYRTVLLFLRHTPTF
jgi:hypothetical protein